MSWPDLDDLDHQIIAILSQDARVSNRKIATDLGVNEGTIRGRLKRLQQDGLIAFTALTSRRLDRGSNMAFVAVQADMQHFRQIARELKRIPTIHSIMTMLGPFNIMTTCVYREIEDLHAVTVAQILAVKGVYHVETSIAVKTVKFTNGVVSVSAANSG
ncbi:MULTISPECIES: Lrp/AsnC family transcriptional regulator [Novosphingobium]|uniref:Transcriptional regulator, AsnC family n=1 Tax=Novosphingobium mathurense TaxID=428990 RepID=A0A1U6HY90_9SPHN|nr:MULTISPECIES: Lrp/AsnC family transcriptional regulator [Novosphingobium]CDO34454.1 Transcriptional regulator, AsnC family [Novosphingobium sp. KN65.2]SLK00684.1 transcriptional regulator, AsnC family [Novosphingobium mathurense]